MQNTIASTDDPRPAPGETTGETGEADIAERFHSGGWRFSPEVARVFPEHVRASVPHYDVIQDLVAEATDWLLPDGGLVADLGAATGTTIARITARHPGRRIRAVLYDREPSMLSRAAAALADAPATIDYVRTDLRDAAFTHTAADLTLALFTLQFLPLADRITALARARTASNATGALIIAEKVRPPDPRWAEISNDVSHDYKAARGISDKAIRAKARALRGVLQPYPHTTLTEMVALAGWCCPEILFRWHAWTVIGAFASPDGL